MTTIEQIKSIASDFGWQVWTDEEPGSIVFDFRNYTKHGQDFGFCAELTDNRINDFLNEVKRYCENFDPDYETYLWIDHDGHGKVGAPYHIKDILNDMEEAEKLLADFYNSLKTALT